MDFLKNKYVWALIALVGGMFIEARTGFFSDNFRALTGKAPAAK